MPAAPRQPSPLTNRLLWFALVCVAAAALAIGYALYARRTTAAPPAVASDPLTVDDPARVAEIAVRPHVVFINTRPGAGRGRITLLPLDNVAGPRFVTPLRCERVFAAATGGVCLGADRGFLTKYYAYTFNASFTPGTRIPLQGIPSRVQMSADGRTAAFTVFVNGDSYSPGHFSTRTTILDVASGRSLGELEQFEVVRDGRPFENQNFNFWGVTFAHASDAFYATLASGGDTWLVEGHVRNRTITVVRPDVECPSISPDDRRIAFKSRHTDQGRLTWEIHVYDLQSHDEKTVETRNVDDQAAWLDNDRVLYALPQATGGTGGEDVWVARADGTGTPQRWIENGYSPAVIRSTR